jgi:hypothetical protein
VERFAAEEIGALEKGVVDPSLRSFGRGFTILEQDLEQSVGGVVRELEEEEEAVAAELRKEAAQAARLIRRAQMEARMGKWVQLIPRGVREIIMPVR